MRKVLKSEQLEPEVALALELLKRVVLFIELNLEDGRLSANAERAHTYKI